MASLLVSETHLPPPAPHPSGKVLSQFSCCSEPCTLQGERHYQTEGFPGKPLRTWNHPLAGARVGTAGKVTIWNFS